MWQGFGSGKNSLGGCYERSLAVPPPCQIRATWNAASCGKPVWGQYGKDSILWEGCHLEERQRVTVGMAEISPYGLTAAPTPCSPPLREKRVDGGKVIFSLFLFLLI